MPLIHCRDVVKEFKVFIHEKGFFKGLKSLFVRKYSIVRALQGVSFDIDRGELVGYIGPNGAGKSTTIKILSGILFPTSGMVEIGGKFPHTNRRENAMRIGVVFGQRSQLYWDLPISDTFELFKKMYKIDDMRYRKNVKLYTELLDMTSFLDRPVRQLSLGQKMRGNLAVALLHNPEILYLDEPTIGLDVVAKNKIRQFIKELNAEKKTTVILTTHDMDDIESICNRIIMIDKGQKLYDGHLAEFKETYSPGHQIIVDLQSENLKLTDGRLHVLKEEGIRKWLSFKKKEISIADAIGHITSNNTILDLSVKEPDIEEVVRDIYEAGKIS